MPQVMYGSVTRIADLPVWPFSFEDVEKTEWEAGDFVVAEVLPREGMGEIFELASGRECSPMAGDLLVGALARRCATLEAVGGTAVYLASDAAACTTGEIIHVDGGFHVMGMPKVENI